MTTFRVTHLKHIQQRRSFFNRNCLQNLTSKFHSVKEGSRKITDFHLILMRNPVATVVQLEPHFQRGSRRVVDLEKLGSDASAESEDGRRRRRQLELHRLWNGRLKHELGHAADWGEVDGTKLDNHLQK
jgi:hypothetical protein